MDEQVSSNDLQSEKEEENENKKEREDGFFEEREEKELPKKEKKPWVGAILLAVTFLVAFCVGAFSTWVSLDPEIRSLIKAKNKIESEYFEEITDEEFYSAIFNAINNDLLDAYSWYMTEEEYAETKSSAQGNRSGFGLSFTAADAEILRISRVSGNSPAENADILSGESIVGGGKTPESIDDFADYEAFAAFVGECATGEEVYLKIKGEDGERLVKLARAEYVENYVYYRTNTKAYRFTGANATDMTEGGETLSALPDTAAYMRLTSFNGSAATQIGKAMGRFRQDGKRDLLLDLRGNGGGYMHILQTIAQYFCKNATDKKPLVSVADYNDHQQFFNADGNVYYEYFSANSRICVLADVNTASASECLLGAMLDYQTIGYGDICLSERNGVAKTYGKGIMQTTFQLPFGQDAIKLTTARVLWPVSSNCIHGIGILPENGALTVEENADDDAEIAKAIEKLGL